LLALGASPIMSDACEEIMELVGIANAVNVNIGTPTPRTSEAMVLAVQSAKTRAIPIALDPVAVAATKMRRDLVDRLLKTASPAVVRGNHAEIAALAGLPATARGVDATGTSETGAAAARALSKALGTVVVASGAIDYLSDGSSVIALENGHSLMARTTGSGCVATAIIAAFLAISPSPFSAAISAVTVTNIAGELAAEHSRSDGPGSFRVRFLDMFDKLEPECLGERIRVYEM
jgi:hydroxyethylthiazole kinase